MNKPHHHESMQVSNFGKAFAIGIGLNILFVGVEAFYGMVAHSSALLADAGHNASDVLSLVFTWTASWLATIRPKGKYTYGLRRTTILVSILNAVLLFAAVVVIGWDAILKLRHPVVVAGNQVMLVAGVGVIVNGITALLFLKGQSHDLNIRSAYLHMAGDTGVSLGVVLAGFLIHITGMQWIDPMVSFVIIAVILWSTWKLFFDSLNLALDAVPRQIDINEVQSFLLSLEGVKNIHDLHIWAMSTTQVALTAHLIMPGGYDDTFITGLQKNLLQKFSINHTTFQIENRSLECKCRAGS